MPAAPIPETVVIEVSGCPALIQWVAAELGTDEKNVQIWMANSLASARDIQPCSACANLKTTATILQDVDGTHVAALTQVISQFASSTAPPTEEQMASIAGAIANNIEGNRQYAAAGEYLDALAKYVGILTSDMGFSVDESVQFATDNYVQKLVEGENVGVATYVAAKLAALGGS
jgi:thioredoxin-like negative regulator of GroEL